MKRIKIETVIFIFIIGTAAMLRFWQLSDQPLMENEAANAYQAMRLAGGEQVTFSGQAGYVLLTSLLFYLFKAGDFLMRFWPALVGTFFVLSPLLFQRQLGRTAAMLIALGLAIDPVLVFQSRIASGEILSIAFFVFTVGFLIKGREIFTGILLTLAILAGSDTWFVLLLGLLVFVVLFLLGRSNVQVFSEHRDVFIAWKMNWSWRSFLMSFFITTVLAGTFFMFVPVGLTGMFSGLASFLSSWSAGQSIPLAQVFGTLLFYETLPLILGLISVGLLMIKSDIVDLGMVVIFILAFLLLLLYPGRQISYLSWFIIPLIVLSARKAVQLSRHWDVEPIPYFGMILLILIAFVYAGMNLKALFTGVVNDPSSYQLQVASIIGAIILVPILSVFVFWGWSWHTASKGLLTAVAIGLLVLNISSLGHVFSFEKQDDPSILRSNVFRDRDLVQKTIAEMQLWASGSEEKMIAIGDLESSALDWSLRRERTISTTLSLGSGNPGMVITHQLEQLGLEESYTGQSFILNKSLLWSEMGAVDWLRWYFTGQAPSIEESIILWVRSDIFPGYETNDNP